MDKLNDNALKKLRNEKGITLMVLIITIIVMVILLGVTVRFSIKGGVISSAEKAENSAIGKIEEGQEEIDKIIEEKNEATILDDAFVPQYIPQYTEENYSDGSGLKNYRIYGNSIQNGTPTPTAPIEIQSVGDKTKNLLNINNEPARLTVCTVETYNNGIKAISNTTNANLNIYYDLGNYADFAGKTLTVSLENVSNTNNRGINIYLVKNSGDWKNNTTITSKSIPIGNKGTVTYTIEEDNTVTNLGIRIYAVNDAVGCEFVIDNIQVEEGTVATAYEPYGYKIPVKASGKNLFDKSSSPVYSNNSKVTVEETETGIKYTNPDVNSTSPHYAKVYTIDRVENIGANTVYISTDVELTQGLTGRIILGYCDENGGNRKTVKEIKIAENGKYSASLSIDVEKYADNYLAVWLYSLSSSVETILEEGTYIEYSNIMLSIGEAEHEPYAEPKTTNIYLDEPLRKIGNYADYIDFKNGRIVRNISYVDLGTITWRYDTTNKYFYSSSLTKREIGSTNMLCTHYPEKYQSLSSGDKYTRGSTTNYIIQVKDLDYEDVTIFKNAMKGKIKYYQLSSPEIQYVNLPKINTIEGNNIITIDTKIQPSNVVLEF